jgi:hypothetical protein
MTYLLSNSEMKGFQRCQRRWWLGQYRRLAPKQRDVANKPLGIGSRLHNALQVYYTPGLEDPDYEMWAAFDRELAEDIGNNPFKEADLRKEADLVRKMLEGYFEWLEETGLDADLELVSAEGEMRVPHSDGVDLISKIDVRVRKRSDPDVRGALEHKSVGSLTEPLRKLQVDSQLLTEHLVEFLALKEEGREEDRAEFVLYNMLRKVKRTANAKPPFYGREEIRHSREELRSHWKHVLGISQQILRTIERLDAGEDPHVVCPPNVTGDCHWECPFAKPCLSGMFDDGSEVEAHLADHFEEADPLERYANLSRDGATTGVSSESADE